MAGPVNFTEERLDELVRSNEQIARALGQILDRLPERHDPAKAGSKVEVREPATPAAKTRRKSGTQSIAG